ncbi:MAG: hypothetical protein ACRD9R_02525 [Pyrinomonadaceae bacterium]
MAEKKEPLAEATPTDEALREREAEATSDETLSDIAGQQKAGAGSPTADASADAAPAPDGMPGGERGGRRADGSDTGGPM